MTDKGYQQAIDNWIYQIQLFTEEIDAMPGDDPLEKVASMMGGEIQAKMGDKFKKLDAIMLVIASEYGVTIEQVERDIDRTFKKKMGDMIMEHIFGHTNRPGGKE